MANPFDVIQYLIQASKGPMPASQQMAQAGQAREPSFEEKLRSGRTMTFAGPSGASRPEATGSDYPQPTYGYSRQGGGGEMPAASDYGFIDRYTDNSYDDTGGRHVKTDGSAMLDTRGTNPLAQMGLPQIPSGPKYRYPFPLESAPDYPAEEMRQRQVLDNEMQGEYDLLSNQAQQFPVDSREALRKIAEQMSRSIPMKSKLTGI